MLFNKLYFWLKSLSIIIFLSLSLSACSFSPIYGDNNLSNKTISLSYAKPTTRLEQIIYQDLKLRLGSDINSANQLIVTISQSTRDVGRSSNGLPASIQELTLVANFKVIDINDSENIIYTGTNRVTATYSSKGQIIADIKAQEKAEETAALELAQIIRLTLLAELNRPIN